MEIAEEPTRTATCTGEAYTGETIIEPATIAKRIEEKVEVSCIMIERSEVQELERIAIGYVG